MFNWASKALGLLSPHQGFAKGWRLPCQRYTRQSSQRTLHRPEKVNTLNPPPRSPLPVTPSASPKGGPYPETCPLRPETSCAALKRQKKAPKSVSAALNCQKSRSQNRLCCPKVSQRQLLKQAVPPQSVKRAVPETGCAAPKTGGAAVQRST